MGRISMGETESIREIARKLIAEYRWKRKINPSVFLAETPADVLAAMEILNEPQFEGVDREWLRQLGIEA
jgi:hypothetical protein